MAGFNPPVPQQDSNWEIRAAVVLSLFFQMLLIFLGPMRKRSSAPLFRLTVWSSYLLADWVADLALGLLLNNMGNIGGGGGNLSSSFGLKHGGGGGGTGATAGNNASSGSSSSPVIFAFWTPFLLLHLGGPDTITAYSVEDNELWNRHLIGLLFELFSASVIIFCSLRGNPLVLATMLMLVAGVIKYGERTYSLYSGNAESLRESTLGPTRRYIELRPKKRAGLPVELAIYDTQEVARLELLERKTEYKSLETRAYELFLTFRKLVVDAIISFRERRLSQVLFLERVDMTPREAFEVMEMELNFMYDMVYTKASVAHSKAGWVLRCVCSSCLVSALLIFFFLDKPRHQIQRVDVGITYTLLLGGVALDAAALLMLFFSNRATVYLEESESSRWLRWLARLRYQVAKLWQTRGRWSGTVSQMNLIRYCQEKPGRPYSSSNKGGKWWLMIVKMLGIEEIVDDFFFIRRVRFIKRRDKKSRFCSWLCRCIREKLIKPLVPRCCDKAAVHEEEEETGESPRLVDFIFDGLKESVQKIKVELETKAEQGERKKTAAQKLKMEQATNEKDAIAEKCRRRGNGVVKSHEDDIKRVKGMTDGDARFKLILDSVVKSDFDESLLLWHIATDLCRYRANETAGDAGETVSVRPVGPLTQKTVETQAIGETLSEYMLYLLIKQPDMLSATAGIGLRPYRHTCAEARQFFAYKEAWLGINKEDDMRIFLLTTEHTSAAETRPALVKGGRSKSMLFNAVILARALRELDEELMWHLITGVWMDMLMFAAVSGRGRTHVRSLNRGGELITFVWLLMQHIGLSDMYEIQEEDLVYL